MLRIWLIEERIRVLLDFREEILEDKVEFRVLRVEFRILQLR